MSAVHRATQAIAPRSAPSDGFASLRAMASGALPRLCHGFASLPKGRRPSATGPRWHRPLVRRHTGPGPPCQDRCRLSRQPVAAAPKIPWEARSPHPWPRLPPSVVTAVSEGESTNHHCLIQSSCNQQTTRENKQLVEIVSEWQKGSQSTAPLYQCRSCVDLAEKRSCSNLGKIRWNPEEQNVFCRQQQTTDHNGNNAGMRS